MTVTMKNPEGLPVVDVYRQVSVATGSKLISVAGQVARTADGERVGEGDLAAQLEQCYRNVATALHAVDASFRDVAKLTIYVVDWTANKMPALIDGMTRAADVLGFAPVPPGTLVGVAALAEPDLLVEVDVIAVID